MNRQPRPHFHKLDWTYREAMEKKKCAPKNCDGNVFLRLPDAALSMIAECMFPVEVYQLILSSNSFLTTTTSDNKFTSSFLLRSSMTSSLAQGFQRMVDGGVRQDQLICFFVEDVVQATWSTPLRGQRCWCCHVEFFR